MSLTAAAAPLTPPQVRDEIRSTLLRVEGDRVVSIILFGSRAKGTARPRSDWDVAVVVRDLIDDWIEESMRLGALFDDSELAIDLHVFGRDEFEADRDLPGTLPSIIDRTGETLYEQPFATPARGRPLVDQVGAR